ncbi:MAG: efflux RND transporter periplasmic adaptor subunit [Hyphomicrobium sp.]|nr:efflux RND transporter periplasmic adaptor subunit [Hyphomicrobium sp.]
MSQYMKRTIAVAALLVAAGAGVWGIRHGSLSFTSGGHTGMTDADKEKSSGPIVYYRDPQGKPFYSAAPKNDDIGQPYIAVHASEDLRFDGASTNSSTASADRKIKFYRNPMGLPDTSPTPKKDSMGMDYIAVYAGEDSDDGTVKVSLGKIQRTGVETTLIGKLPFTRTIKAPAVVQIDERRVSVVTPRFDGFVESIGTATTGTQVEQGSPLVTVFGQDVLNQGVRLVVEQNAGGRGDEATALSDSKLAPVGVIGARRRLLNLGVPEDYIGVVARDRRVPDTLTYRAANDGVILERNVVAGQAFKSGDTLFRLADLSVVWIMADISEGDIAAVKPGQLATVTTRAHPGRVFTGKVAVVYPQVMKETRTARVRIELQNNDLALLPEMYGSAEIATGDGNDAVVTVPSSAIIDSGSQQVVLVALGEGRYDPRRVKLGRIGDGFTEIIDGVSEGDKVVTNGNFLLDAESNLQAALKSFAAPSEAERAP